MCFLAFGVMLCSTFTKGYFMVPVMSLMAPVRPVRLHIPAGEAGDVFSHTRNGHLP